MTFKHAALFLTFPALGLAQTDKVVTKDHFKNPPPEYRPFAGADRPLPPLATLEGVLSTTYTTNGFGGFMWAPSDAGGAYGTPAGLATIVPGQTASPSTGTSPGPATSATVRHAGGGLQATHPPGQSPWVMISPPGTTPARSPMGGLAANVGGSQARPPAAQQPAYLSKEYFDLLREFLRQTKSSGHKAVFYDEVGFPSGMADHTAPMELHRKILDKTEETITGATRYQKAMPNDGMLMAVVAMNTTSHKRIDLTPLVRENALTWQVPSGTWRVMIFYSRPLTGRSRGVDYDGAVDYLDPVASQWFVDKVYEQHFKEVGEYFGNTIVQSFFDDVGIFSEERTWTYKFNDKFKAITGKDAAIYYPALWEDIGPETEAARVAFFNTRAELLADGFPKVVTDWGAKHNLSVTGHSPGNYEIQPVDMCADPFKFDRAQPIPMADVIFNYPFGRDGFKLASDGGDLYDKPIVNAETFAAFTPGGTTAGYRRMMELYVRGINRFSGAGLGNGAQVESDHSRYAEWAGRTSLLLQGGRRVSEIAMFYPIASLQAYYRFDASENTAAMRSGSFVPYDTDYLAVGEMLENQVHRDFTFVSPDIFTSDKIKIHGNSLNLDNTVNYQSFKALILPGEKVISLLALQKIKAYYDAGGNVVATSLLPSVAAELPASNQEAVQNNQKVQTIIRDMFGVNSSGPMPESAATSKKSVKGGKAIFIRKPDPTVLSQALNQLGIDSDVSFSNNPTPSSAGGAFSYVHKNKEGHDLYFFANSSDDSIDTVVEVRGTIEPQLWDPYTGETKVIKETQHIQKRGEAYTSFPLSLSAVTSTFVVNSF